MKAPIEQLKPFPQSAPQDCIGYENRRKIYGDLPKGWCYRNLGDRIQEKDVAIDSIRGPFYIGGVVGMKIYSHTYLVVYYTAPKKRPFRVLKVKKVGEKDGNVEYKIVAQSHRNQEFTPKSSDKTLFRAKNGVKLYSDGWPATYGENDSFYFRGRRKDRDNDLICFPVRLDREFLDAIKEYNEFYAEAPKDAPAPVAPPAPKVEAKEEKPSPKFSRVEWKEYFKRDATIFHIISAPATINTWAGEISAGKMFVKEGSINICSLRCLLEEINSILP